jgi:hypothetical protein
MQPFLMSVLHWFLHLHMLSPVASQIDIATLSDTCLALFSCVCSVVTCCIPARHCNPFWSCTFFLRLQCRHLLQLDIATLSDACLALYSCVCSVVTCCIPLDIATLSDVCLALFSCVCSVITCCIPARWERSLWWLRCRRQPPCHEGLAWSAGGAICCSWRSFLDAWF